MKTILDGGLYYEGPRWHDGRLWFVDCMARTLLSVSPAGDAREHASFDDTPCGTGVLPDGRLLVLTMFKKRLFAFADGKLAPYADLSAIASGTIDDMIVDGLGRAWVGDLGFDLPPPPDRGADGRIILVMPDGTSRVVAEGLRFPNGIAVSPDQSAGRGRDGWRRPRRLRAGGRRPAARAQAHLPEGPGRHLPRSRGCGLGRFLR
jgi:sugar lactone lactonase YvrE